MHEFSYKVVPHAVNVDGIYYENLLNVDGDSGTWVGPTGDWQGKEGHKEHILETVKNFRTVVQAGGAFGLYPLLLSEMFERVYTFEPYPVCFHCLVHNCPKENVVKINAALGEKHQMIKMKINCMGNFGMNTVDSDAKPEDTFVPMLMLDDFEFEHLDLLMLDVERYECGIITGGMKTIEKHRPVIFAENGAIDNLIERFGYRRYTNSAADTVYVAD